MTPKVMTALQRACSIQFKSIDEVPYIQIIVLNFVVLTAMSCRILVAIVLCNFKFQAPNPNLTSYTRHHYSNNRHAVH